jgi:hypothetical protein
LKIDSQIVFFWLLPLSNWLHNWIGLSGLLLLISDLFAIPVSVLWVGLEKKNVLKTWMWETFFAVSHTEHRWRCSKIICPAHVDRAS